MAVPMQGDTGNVEGGNKNVFGDTGAVSSRSREDSIIDRTRTLAFPDGAVLSLENFEHCGDRPAGSEQQVNDMVGLTGKVLQESYRVGAVNQRGMSGYTDKVTDR
jgi:hypothetical protein